ncbi:MAG: hypothetical protein LBD18_05220 [Treponema sp.]|nr:hypothetical protein [Treponema sp.]
MANAAQRQAVYAGAGSVQAAFYRAGTAG